MRPERKRTVRRELEQRSPIHIEKLAQLLQPPVNAGVNLIRFDIRKVCRKIADQSLEAQSLADILTGTPKAEPLVEQPCDQDSAKQK
jgi:hypothetical protein